MQLKNGGVRVQTPQVDCSAAFEEGKHLWGRYPCDL